jgi:hypothetical protein
MEIAKPVFFVESEEAFALCPYCGSYLEHHSRVIRVVTNITGIKNSYSIRVLKCVNEACPSKYHRELPDFIVPYRRYDAQSIEEAIDLRDSRSTVAADEATIQRWRKWVVLNGTHMLMALLSVIATMENSGTPSSLANEKTHPGNPSQVIKKIIGQTSGWLGVSTRILVNSSKWRFNRSAFLTG